MMKPELQHVVTSSGIRLVVAEQLDSGGAGTGFLLEDGRFLKLFHSPDARKRQCLDQLISTFNCTRDQLPGRERYWKSLLSWPEAIVEQPGLGLIARAVPSSMSPLVRMLVGRLERKLRPAGRRWRVRLVIAWRTAQAVARLHTSGLVHTDLSPNNIFTDPETGHVQLIDNDGALAAGNDWPADVVGTPFYAAPECLDTPGSVPTFHADRHALAVLVHELLLFRHPLQGPFNFGLPSQEIVAIKARQQSQDGIYIAHPTDHRNRPEVMCPPELLGQEIPRLFERAFVQGLRCPEARPHPAEFERALAKLTTRLVTCTSKDCVRTDFPLLLGPKPECPWCGTGFDTSPIDAIMHLFENDGTGIAPIPQLFQVVAAGTTVAEWLCRAGQFPTPWNSWPPLAIFTSTASASYLVNLALDDLAVRADPNSAWIPVPPGRRVQLTHDLVVRLGPPQSCRYGRLTLRSRTRKRPTGSRSKSARHVLETAVDEATSRPSENARRL